MATGTDAVAQDEESSIRAALIFARVIGSLAVIFGIAVLVGWRLEEPLLLQGYSRSMTTPPNTAVGILLAGLGLLALSFRHTAILARLFALLLIAGAGATLSQDMWGWNLGIDDYLFAVPLEQRDGAWPDRMSPGAALALLLIGCVLLTSARRAWLMIVVTECLLAAVFVLAITSLISHSYEFTQLYNPFPFTAMPVHMGIMLALIAAGLSAACPDRGFAKALLDPSAGGQMIRRLLPGIVAVPLLLGWLVHFGLVKNIYSGAAGTALFAVSTIVIMTVFVWITAVALRYADQERQDALVALHRQRESLRTTLVSIADAVIATGDKGEIVLMNPAAEELTGWTLPEARASSIREVLPIFDEDAGESLGDPAASARREEDAAIFYECLLARKDGGRVPIELTTSPILTPRGKSAGAVLVFRDITQRRRAEEQQELMVGELNHRVRNILMIVQSLVQASALHTEGKSAKEMSKALSQRIQSVGRAHGLLLETHWSGASLKQLVELELAPYRQDASNQIVLKGRDVLLPPQCTSIVAMVMHELATNAAKYGALSRPDGKLSVDWKVRRSALTINWLEKNIQVPEDRSLGFGSRMIEKGIKQNLGGDASISFGDDSLTVNLTIALVDPDQ